MLPVGFKPAFENFGVTKMFGTWGALEGVTNIDKSRVIIYFGSKHSLKSESSDFHELSQLGLNPVLLLSH